MHRRTLIIVAAIAAAVLAIGGGVYWLSQPSYDDTVRGCQKALAAQTKARGEGKPTACEDVSDDDYANIIVANVIDGMPKKDRDTLDYFDNGTIDGSLD